MINKDSWYNLEDFKSLTESFLSKHKEAIIAVAITAVIIIAAVCAFNHFNLTKVHDVTKVPNTKPATLQQYFPMSSGDAKDLSRHIDAAQQSAPTYHFYSVSDSAADKQAQQYAAQSKDKVDHIVKTQESSQVGNSTVYDNKYYAVSLERKHGISAGVAAIDNKAVANLSYRNRRTTYSVLYDSKGHIGAGVSYEFARW